MTQKQLIDQFCEFRGKCTTDDVVALNFAYSTLTPQWISVEDKLPMELEPVLAAFGNHYARVCFYNGGKWYIDAGVMSDEAFGVSHWIQIPPPPKKGGEE